MARLDAKWNDFDERGNQQWNHFWMAGPSGATPSFGVSDTALSFSDSPAVTRVLSRAITDTALSFSDTVVRTETPKIAADTALSFSDSLGVLHRPFVQDDAIGYNATDSFARTTSAGSLGGNWVNVSATTLWSVDGAEGVLGPFVSGSANTRNAELQTNGVEGQAKARFRWDQVPVGGSRSHGLHIRAESSTSPSNTMRVRAVVNTSGGTNLTITAVVGGAATVLYNATASVQPVANQWHWLKIEYAGGRARAKIWLDGTLEPSTWEADVADTAGVPANFYTGLHFQYVSGETDTPTFQFDDFSWRVFDTLVRTSIPAIADTALSFSDSLVRTSSRSITDTALTFSDTFARVVSRAITDYVLGGIPIADEFNRTVTASTTASWGTTDTGQTWSTLATTSGQTYGVNGSQATNSVPAGTSARRGQSVPLSGPNQEAVAAIGLDVLPTGASYVSEVLLRVTDVNNLYGADMLITTSGNIQSRLRKVVAGSGTVLVASSNVPGIGTYTPGSLVWVRGRIDGSILSVKIWQDGTLEPSAWTAQTTDTSIVSGSLVGVGGQANASQTNAQTQLVDHFSSETVFYDSVGITVQHSLVDTALSFSDSLGRLVARSLTDSALTFSDTVGSLRSRTLTDTALSFSDSLARIAVPRVVDTALSFSDSLSLVRVRTITDTALSFSDSLVARHTAAVSDTVLVFSDSLTSSFSHPMLITENLSAPESTDDFTETFAGGWDTDDQGDVWTISGTGAATKTGSAGQLTAGTNTNTKAQLTTVSALNAEALVQFSIPHPTGGSTDVDVLLRVSGTNNYRGRIIWSTGNALTLSIAAIVGGTGTTLSTTSIGSGIPGAKWWIRFRVGGNQQMIKAWADGTSEPSTWTSVTTDSSVTAAGNPAVRLTTNTGTTGTPTLSVYSWTYTPGLADADYVGIAVIDRTPTFADEALAMDNPVTNLPLVGAGALPGLGVRTTTHPQNFDRSRFSSQSVEVQYFPRFTHTLYDFAASATNPGPFGSKAIGEDELWLMTQSPRVAPIANIGGRLNNYPNTDFPGYNGTHGTGDIGLVDVTNGVYDSTIKGWALALRGLPGNIFVRLWREPSSGHPWWTATPAHYIAAYRRVWTIFRGDQAAWTAAGISGTPIGASNCKFMWCVGTFTWWNNDGSAGNSQAQLPFYPGDDVTDALAADGYENLGQTWDNADFFSHFAGTGPVGATTPSWYDWAKGRGIPLIISETGAQPDPAGVKDVGWVNSIASGLTAMPEVRALIPWVGQNNYPIVQSDGASAAVELAYKALFAQPYLSSNLQPDHLTANFVVRPLGAPPLLAQII